MNWRGSGRKAQSAATGPAPLAAGRRQNQTMISSAALNAPPAPTWLLMSSMILIIALPVTLVRAGWTREAA